MTAERGTHRWGSIVLVVLALLVGGGWCTAQTPEAGSEITEDVTFDGPLDLTEQNFTGTVFTVVADGIKVDGQGYLVTAPKASLGIALTGRLGVTITNVKIVGPATGIGLTSSHGNVIQGCDLSWSGTTPTGMGISLGGGNSDNNQFIDNNCSGRRTGIEMATFASTGNVMDDNDCRGCWTGIWIKNQTDAVISGNDCTGTNNGISLSATCSGVEVTDNVCQATAVGVTINGSQSITLERVVVYDSWIGVDASSSSDVDMINCTIAGCAIGVSPAANPASQIRNCIIWDNGDDIHATDPSPIIATHSDIGESLWPGTGNISTDPLFVDAGAGDYHLAGGSPCIDAGDASDPVPPNGGDPVDMGAFESDRNHPPEITDKNSGDTIHNY